MSSTRHLLRCLLLSLVVAGLFVPAYAKGHKPDREVTIESDCHIDYEVVNLRANKKHTLHWASDTGTDSFDIHIVVPSTVPAANSPCLDKKGNPQNDFHVQNGNDSDKCYVNPNATQYTPFKYSITVPGQNTACNDPVVVVQDGRVMKASGAKHNKAAKVPEKK